MEKNVRVFNGTKFHSRAEFESKEEAERYAKTIRRTRRKVRIIKTKGIFGVYVGPARG